MSRRPVCGPRSARVDRRSVELLPLNLERCLSTKPSEKPACAGRFPTMRDASPGEDGRGASASKSLPHCRPAPAPDILEDASSTASGKWSPPEGLSGAPVSGATRCDVTAEIGTRAHRFYRRAHWRPTGPLATHRWAITISPIDIPVGALNRRTHVPGLADQR